MKKPFVVLGVYEGHMASAALMIDGELIAAAHEERFSKIKNDVGMPIQSILFCLSEAKLKAEDIDEVYLSNLDFNKNGISNLLLKRQALYSVDDWIKENQVYWKKIFYENKRMDQGYYNLMGGAKRIKKIKHYYDISKINFKEDEKKLKKKFNILRKDTLSKFTGIKRNKIRFVDHYLCHHYHAYYSSPFRDNKTVVVHLEGDGGKYNNAVSIPSQKGLKIIEGSNQANVGRLYQWMTLLLGMKPYHHEYKIMGLAPYANKYEKQKSLKTFSDLFKLSKSKLTIVKRSKPKDLYFYFLEKLKGHRFDGIAGALQENTEKIIYEWIKNVIKITGKKNVCYGGGVAMNVKANYISSKINLVNKFFVPIAPSDESNAIGACYFGTEKKFLKNKIDIKKIKHLNNPYLGNKISISSEEILKIFRKKLNFKFKFYHSASAKFIGKLLSEGKILGRVSGKSEFGQRALGNRSILADPSNLKIKKKINEIIKKRDFWMPFCPSILEEYKNKVLLNPKKNSANFMTLAFSVSKKFEKKLSGVIHEGDLTCRPHIVSKKINKDYYNIIREFYKIKKIPALLNTSFNLHGKPIVSDINDVIYFLNKTNIDGVIINNCLLLRKKI